MGSVATHKYAQPKNRYGSLKWLTKGADGSKPFHN